MALQFAFKVETTLRTNSGATNITDKTPRRAIGSADKKKRCDMSYCQPSDRYYQVLYMLCSRWDFINYGSPEIFFNLVYQSVKCDSNRTRICAFSKRLIHGTMSASVGWICGALFLISAIAKHHHFVKHTLFYRQSVVDRSDADKVAYDMNHLQPKLSNADACGMWELSCLRQHVHPAVRQFATQLLQKGAIDYSGDPIHDFERKVLFEKFVQILAHRTKDFRVRHHRNQNKSDDGDNGRLLAGDEFIALYQKQSDRLPTMRKEKREKKKKALGDDIPSDDESPFEDSDEEETFIMDYMRANFGQEMMDDVREMREVQYDMTDFAKEVGLPSKMVPHPSAERKTQEEESDSDIDIYVDGGQPSDIDNDSDGDNDSDIGSAFGSDSAAEAMESDILADDNPLQSDVEYASDEPSDDSDSDSNGDKNAAANFFDSDGVGAGQLNVNA